MMDQKKLTGRAHVYGDDVNTDLIIAGKYTKTLDLGSLAAHVMEDLDPDFRARVGPGDMVIAGDNFGCGSSREQAPLALKSAGVALVGARYFARIFFRSAINIGLPVMEVDWEGIETGDELTVYPLQGRLLVPAKGLSFTAPPLPSGMMAILEAGGLTAFLRKFGDYPT